MDKLSSLERYVNAQKRHYETALSEISSGKKKSHWMWYVFPQLDGLGHSEMAKYYALKSLSEAQAYLEHPVLGSRLIRITAVLLKLKDLTANQIFGSPDDLKLRSSMTLFNAVKSGHKVFQDVLDRFYGGLPDQSTLRLLNVG